MLDYISRHALLHPGDRLGVAVSGGADSVALLRLLHEGRRDLGVVLSVVHFNHRIRGAEADSDQQFVADLAAKLDLPFLSDSADTPEHAREHKLSLEAAARQLRYAFFRRLLQRNELDRIATAHTLDDQAETVLLRVLRGTGTSGLAAIHPEIKLAGGKAIIRPLLSTRRAGLIAHLRELNQPWCEDITNLDPRYTRNRVRHHLLPQLERDFNPKLVGSLGDLAEIARAEDEFWASQTAEAFLGCFQNGQLVPGELKKLPLALQRRVIRAAAHQAGLSLDFEHIERVRELISGTHDRPELRIELPGGALARLNRSGLSFSLLTTKLSHPGFSYRLPIPGQIEVPELGTTFRTFVICGSPEYERYNHASLLAKNQLTSELVIRNWQPGDRFWPAHTRGASKVKALLASRKLSAREKQLWPVAVAGSEIVWMRGFEVPARLRPTQEEAVVLEEVPLAQGQS